MVRLQAADQRRGPFKPAPGEIRGFGSPRQQPSEPLRRRSGLKRPVDAEALEDPVDLHDFHATMLRQFGFDHLKLTHRFSGRDFRLTDVSGRVIKEWIA